MIWRLPHDTPNVPGLLGRALPDGIPSEADYIAGYCRAAGLSEIPQYDFYLAFSFFRFAAIAQGIYARWKSGNAAAANAEQVGFAGRAAGGSGLGGSADSVDCVRRRKGRADAQVRPGHRNVTANPLINHINSSKRL